jgi:hypothetical protein
VFPVKPAVSLEVRSLKIHSLELEHRQHRRLLQITDDILEGSLRFFVKPLSLAECCTSRAKAAGIFDTSRRHENNVIHPVQPGG